VVINGVKRLKPGKGRSFNVFGDTVACKLTGEESGDFFSVFEVSVPPGNGQPIHRHLRDEEAYYVLHGQFEFHLNGQSESASPGTFMHFPRGTLHGYRNTGETEGKLLAIFSPAGMEYFFEEIDSRSKTQPLDDEQAFEIAKRHSIIASSNGSST
jgi:quercetin dioxygenase-like cupin family protein